MVDYSIIILIFFYYIEFYNDTESFTFLGEGGIGMKVITLVVPCYNEKEMLYTFFDEVTKIASEMRKVRFEFLFIDDGSKDCTLSLLKELKRQDERVRFISFSRNFGKEAALYAGLRSSTGDYVAVMDADLQDPPSLLKEMYRILENEDYDCVATRRATRAGEPAIRSFFAKKFYQVINKISKTEIVDGARDFRLMTRQMVDAILSMNEYNRFSKGLFGWVGFKTKWISYENVERIAGESKWSFGSLMLYALDGIIAFSTAPLIISSILGLVFCVIAFIMIFVVILKTIVWGDPVAGYPSLISILFFLSGIQLFGVGVLGQYLSKLYMEVKNRPIYIEKCTEKDFEGEEYAKSV